MNYILRGLIISFQKLSLSFYFSILSFRLSTMFRYVCSKDSTWSVFISEPSVSYYFHPLYGFSTLCLSVLFFAFKTINSNAIDEFFEFRFCLDTSGKQILANFAFSTQTNFYCFKDEWISQMGESCHVMPSKNDSIIHLHLHSLFVHLTF